MSCEPIVIRVSDLSKGYQIYNKPADRLLQFLISATGRLTGIRASAKYREFHSLSSVSLDVFKGETVGIIGLNGSGKSTLLQLICGTLHPTKGHVEVQGRVAALLELGSGFNPEFTGRDNVFLNASVLGLTRKETETRFASITEFADIGEFIDLPLKTYSSGMALRLAFAVIAHVDADILVIDEALAVGDAIFTQKCMRFLRNFMKKGTVLFVSHDIESIKALCKRVVWLGKGVVVQDGPTKEVCQRYQDALFLDHDKARPTTPRSPTKPPDFRLPMRDPRLDRLNASKYRNDIELMAFDPSSARFGVGGALIREVRLLDTQGNQLVCVFGGELVELEIIVQCLAPLSSPVIGFMVKDKTGQALFGDNTYLSADQHTAASAPGSWLKATFIFEMPRLPAGNYSTVVAVVDGSQEDCVHHHWVHDALTLQSVASSVTSGLIGIPMRHIAMQAISPPSVSGLKPLNPSD